MGPFHLKKQRWRRFPEVAEVEPLTKIPKYVDNTRYSLSKIVQSKNI
jgi:hypothetical protein